MNISLDRLTAAIRESSRTLNVDNFKEDGGKNPSIQRNNVDSIELSYKAIELSTQNHTETGFKEKPDTNQEQEEGTGTNQQQEPAFTRTVSLDYLA